MSLVLVGVDESGASQSALEWALDDATRTGASIEVLYAWQPPVYGGYPAHPLAWGPPEEALRSCAAAVRSMLFRAGHESPDDAPPCTVTIVADSAARALERASERADVLVVGERPAWPMVRVALGSVALACLRHPHGVVVIVPERARLKDGAARVVAGLDEDEHWQHAVRWAAQEASARGAGLELVAVLPAHQWDLAGLSLGQAASERVLEEGVRRALAAAPDVAVTSTVLVGRPGEALTRHTEGNLLVLGGHAAARGHGPGTTGRYCAEHARGPVAVVAGPHF